MRTWQYVALGVAVVALIAFIISNNRDEGSEVAGRGDDTSQDTAAGALDNTLYTLNPQASIELLLEQSNLPQEVVPALTQAQELYVQASTLPAEEAIPLLESAVDQLNQAADQVEAMAQDASNQVTADNYRRLSTSILVISDRVQDDVDQLKATGTPIAITGKERIAA